MEGILYVPPDRGTIIGRAVWKQRYVVVGSPQRDVYQPNLSLSQVLSTSRIKESKGRDSKPQNKPPPDAVYLSIYKSKDDWEPVQQHSMASITECHVQMIAHRKQGPVLPTLIIQVSPDPATDKLRKRRSSRTAGLTTTKDSGPITLWFRTGDDHQYTLQDWARYICSMIQPGIPDTLPMSPISPTSPTFVNPFSPRERKAQDNFQRPSSGNAENRRSASQKMGKNGRERPKTFTSESMSLRSRKSDVSSSQASSTNPPVGNYMMNGQHYTTVLPTDLPSPATTVNEYQGEYMLGWTSAQGRSSTLNSPIRTRESVGAQGPAQLFLESGSSPAPRETILDRAFQLRCIPGSDREVPGEEKLSSLARFDALMRETEERRMQERQETVVHAMTTWDEDVYSQEDDFDEEVDDDTDDDAFEQDVSEGRSRKALPFVSNRHSSHTGKTSMNYHTDAYQLNGAPGTPRPHTAHSKMRPSTQRTSSQQHFSLPSSETVSSNSKGSEESTMLRPHHEKRHSTSSVKRLSFNEFTKRLSSTSSLLLVQTNASATSTGSGEIEMAQQTALRSANLRSTSKLSHDADHEDSCAWRGSVGVFGGGSGFI
ncbi:uncharacterized protein BCR38DRAFT_479645 [Pseudomassariella vexata]|uniref:Uncharacterized protein n=1 Tax=Pseudomassariella vexata TaxID=1141098 RepID=A0A1Y2EJY3_9PEZI|nr:uncharacterized protein BCR38DRAFT_479645 [Pseudomassariella vexata]ORY71125.1 hypothetical protein BCR38DRAFT_479645 [Pseudomassariella vexata]